MQLHGAKRVLGDVWGNKRTKRHSATVMLAILNHLLLIVCREHSFFQRSKLCMNYSFLQGMFGNVVEVSAKGLTSLASRTDSPPRTVHDNSSCLCTIAQSVKTIWSIIKNIDQSETLVSSSSYKSSKTKARGSKAFSGSPRLPCQ